MSYSDSHCLASPLFESIGKENVFQEKGFGEAEGLGEGVEGEHKLIAKPIF